MSATALTAQAIARTTRLHESHRRGGTLSWASLEEELDARVWRMNIDFAERFRDLRVRAGLTKMAAAKPRYTVSFVSQIESGRRKPSAEAMAFFAHRLGVTTEFLATGIPDGVEDNLRYRLEETRRAVRETDLDRAERHVTSVIGLSEEYGFPRLRAQALALRGEVRILQGHVRDAVDLYEEALEADLPERERGTVVVALARAYRAVGDLTYASELVESFLAEDRGVPLDPGLATEMQTVLISIYFERGDVLRAERAASRALASAGEETPPEIRANSYWAASRVMAEARRWDEALELATRARLIMEELDDRRRVAQLHNAYAFICLEADPPRTEEAASHLDVVVALEVHGDLVGAEVVATAEVDDLADHLRVGGIGAHVGSA
jgi:tetratricopeptide (TPR) repeat protein